MARVGLYFGSFNPIHIGHLAIAGYMKEFTGLDQVWFVSQSAESLKEKETPCLPIITASILLSLPLATTTT